jgi:hypothetical protein
MVRRTKLRADGVPTVEKFAPQLIAIGPATHRAGPCNRVHAIGGTARMSSGINAAG